MGRRVAVFFASHLRSETFVLSSSWRHVSDMVKKEGRQEAARWIVRTKRVRTQGELVQELRKLGYPCTQATASRDIADLGLRKGPSGSYVLSEDLHLYESIQRLALHASYVSIFCVIHTPIGSALVLADAFDKADIDGVLGTIAGKDTVLIICSDDGAAVKIHELVSAQIVHGADENW